MSAIPTDSDKPIFVGLRDGEESSEDLMYGYEYLEQTPVPKISRVRGNGIPDADNFVENLARLHTVVMDRKKTALLDSLVNIVPEFTPSPALLRCIN